MTDTSAAEAAARCPSGCDDDCDTEAVLAAAQRDSSETDLAQLRAKFELAMRSGGSDECEGCGCCTRAGCHRRGDATCPTNALGDSVCPCTED